METWKQSGSRGLRVQGLFNAMQPTSDFELTIPLGALFLECPLPWTHTCAMFGKKKADCATSCRCAKLTSRRKPTQPHDKLRQRLQDNYAKVAVLCTKCGELLVPWQNKCGTTPTHSLLGLPGAWEWRNGFPW